MASNSLKNPGKILEFCGCGKVGTLKNLQPLKIKIPKQSKHPKCEKEKPMCEAKSNLKRKLEKEEEVENK